MALGIFSKISLISKSGAHSLLDKIIDANSVEALEQFIRELEAAMQAESTETIKADVMAKGLHQQIASIQSQVDQFNNAINRLLGDDDPSNDKDAEPMAAHVIELEDEIENLKAQETAANENHQLLSDTLDKLKERHTTMVTQLRQLRAAKSQTAADNKAANAVRNIQNLTTGVDSVHLGGALANAQNQSAVAREELRQAVGSIQSTPEALLQKSKAEQRIAEMRAKLQTPK